MTASANVKDPQTFNRYSYAMNSPYKFTDPLGLLPFTGTGACGQWCSNSDLGGGGGGGITGAMANAWASPVPGAESSDVIERTETTIIHATLNSRGSANITVTIIKKTYTNIENGDGEIAGPGTPTLPRDSTTVGVKVSNVKGKPFFSDSQKSIIEAVTKDIVEIATEKGVEAKLAIAIGIKESKLGVGGYAAGNISKKTGEPFPHKVNNVNPLQLSSGRGKAGVKNRRRNIRGALDVYKDFRKRRSSMRSALAGFGGEGVKPAQQGYSSDVMNLYNSTPTTHMLSSRCISGC